MSKAENEKSGGKIKKPGKTKGGKQSRSETVSVRLDPKIRYFAELAARKQRRSLSSFIEWAVEQSFPKIVLALDFNNAGDDSVSVTLADEIYNLWSFDDTGRFVLLALKYPALLNHEEQAFWEIINKAHLLHEAQNPNGSLNPEAVEQNCLPFICYILPFLKDLYFNKPYELNIWIERIKKAVLKNGGKAPPVGWNYNDDLKAASHGKEL